MGLYTAILTTTVIALSQAGSAKDPDVVRPNRPLNPIQVKSQADATVKVRPSMAEVSASIARVRARQKAIREEQKPSLDDMRTAARLEVVEIRIETSMKAQEMVESIKRARALAKEQRKLSDEERDALIELARGRGRKILEARTGP